MSALRLADLSLRIKLAGAFALLVAGFALLLVVLFPSRLDDVAGKWAERRGVGITLVLAAASAPALAFDDVDTVERVLANLNAAPGALYAAVYRQDGSRFGAWHEERAPTSITLPGPEPLVIVSPEAVKVTARIMVGSEVEGALTAGFSLDELAADKRENLILFILVAGAVTLAGLLFSLWLGNWLVRPVEGLTQLAARIIGTGDLTQQVNIPGRDEVGQLAASFGELMERQRVILLAVTRLATDLAGVIERASNVATTVASGASTIGSSVERTSQSMEDNLGTLRLVAQSVEVLHESANASSASLEQMGVSTRTVAESVATMSQSVDETANAIEQMTEDIKKTSWSLDQVTTFVTETSSSMTELDTSFRSVQRTATETATLSRTVTDNAERGMNSIEKTLVGIEEISASNREGAQVIARLGGHIHEIGSILEVITVVADQTNLLSLNAAIVAAQAGESGRGFAIVASEIKQLAERTRLSTREIADIVGRIQSESRQAVSTIDAGIASVEKGITLGHETRGALEKIVGSARTSAAMADAIASATVEQVSSSEQVTQAIHRVATTVEELSESARGQAEGSERIMASTARMRQLTGVVQQAIQEQNQVSMGIIRALKSINDMVIKLRQSQIQQTRSSERIRDSVGSIRGVAVQQNELVSQLEAAIRNVARQADSLRTEVGRFRV